MTKNQVVISVAASLSEPALPFGAHGDHATTECRVSGTENNFLYVAHWSKICKMHWINATKIYTNELCGMMVTL